MKVRKQPVLLVQKKEKRTNLSQRYPGKLFSFPLHLFSLLNSGDIPFSSSLPKLVALSSMLHGSVMNNPVKVRVSSGVLC